MINPPRNHIVNLLIQEELAAHHLALTCLTLFCLACRILCAL